MVDCATNIVVTIVAFDDEFRFGVKRNPIEG